MNIADMVLESVDASVCLSSSTYQPSLTGYFLILQIAYQLDFVIDFIDPLG